MASPAAFRRPRFRRRPRLRPIRHLVRSRLVVRTHCFRPLRGLREGPHFEPGSRERHPQSMRSEALRHRLRRRGRPRGWLEISQQGRVLGSLRRNSLTQALTGQQCQLQVFRLTSQRPLGQTWGPENSGRRTMNQAWPRLFVSVFRQLCHCVFHRARCHDPVRTPRYCGGLRSRRGLHSLLQPLGRSTLSKSDQPLHSRDPQFGLLELFYPAWLSSSELRLWRCFRVRQRFLVQIEVHRWPPPNRNTSALYQSSIRQFPLPAAVHCGRLLGCVRR